MKCLWINNFIQFDLVKHYQLINFNIIVYLKLLSLLQKIKVKNKKCFKWLIGILTLLTFQVVQGNCPSKGNLTIKKMIGQFYYIFQQIMIQ